jgi:toxin ParE1/3/4
MKLKMVQAPRVQSHLIEYYSRIIQDKVVPGERFLEVAAESFERLAESPMIGTAWPTSRRHLAGIRCYPMPGPYRSYVIFYRVVEDSIQVLGILHGARQLDRAVEDIADLY